MDGMEWYGGWVGILPLSVELWFYPQKHTSTRTKSRIGFTVSDSCLT